MKKGKDPNAPKRPMSAYMLWLNASREKIKSDHPGISITDLSKKAGEIWKGMSKEKKEVNGSRDEGWDLVADSGGRDGPSVHLFCTDFACIREEASFFSLSLSFLCVCVCVYVRETGVGSEG